MCRTQAHEDDELLSTIQTHFIRQSPSTIKTLYAWPEHLLPLILSSGEPTTHPPHHSYLPLTARIDDYPNLTVRSEWLPLWANPLRRRRRRLPSRTPPPHRTLKHLALLALLAVSLTTALLHIATCFSTRSHLAAAVTASDDDACRIPCAEDNAAATWTTRPLGSPSSTTFASPFEPAPAAATGPYPSRAHFTACGATFRRSDALAAAARRRGVGGVVAVFRQWLQAAFGIPARAGKPGKFFREVAGNSHLDARFAHRDGSPAAAAGAAAAAVPAGVPPGGELAVLLRAWTEFASEANSTTWIAHGTLLGWWWTGGALPWDDDVDVQTTLRDLDGLARRWNGTRRGGRDGGRYLFEVNPGYLRRYPEADNTIDARFVDTETGRFVDVTAVAEVPAAVSVAVGRGGEAATREKEDVGSARKDGDEDGTYLVTCKSPHVAMVRDLFPLRRTTFEGIDVYVPFDAEKILLSEYGMKSLTQTVIQGHVYDAAAKRWVRW
ncbi:LicD family-domain-containing protein [Zopfochytrium polystomum]|nr:LicD family-domain-containing protein [Zopfochytrium polystomum]